MSGSASSTTAEIYMQVHEQTAAVLTAHTLKKLGNVLFILNHTQLKSFFHHINYIYQNIKFTREEGSNGELAFPDTIETK